MKRVRAKKQAARPKRATKLRVVKPAAPPPRPLASLAPEERAFGSALVTATSRERILFELRRGRASVHAAIKGMSAAAAERPLGPDKWCTREIVLHLASRDQARLREMESALRGVEISWRVHADSEWPRLNEADLADLRHHSWDEAIALLELTRERLLESIESVPDEPAEVWAETHPFGWMLRGLPPHDRHHADQIKRWITTRGA
ncbi:MAG: hypothetical protein HOP12_14090 [Candidatus Eisenbacteria bacterium]|uniref:DinB-like domain-containing protein n=1 Tax=Eiseniibacteriota bacterium TaxID=2212470 RepID=A0A849SV86_UNCEI|nr:hypothetical protein [Candidatus Eisenbacteria bacterium]